MRDDRGGVRFADTDLTCQAFQYARGELSAEETIDFEDRLEADQAARDALCQAVRFCSLVRGWPPASPDPSYRLRVKQRLRADLARPQR